METRNLQRVHEDRATPVDSVTAKIRIVTIESLFGLCRLGVVLVCLAGLFVVAGSAQAVMVQQQTITQTDGAANDLFGISIALSSDGNTAIVGASGDNSNQGSATVFTRSGTTWTQQQTITQTDGAANDYFGVSVALSSDGNTAIVGAHGDNSTQGSASVFTRSGATWTLQQAITQTDGAANDYFGASVALSSDGNTAIVGASGDDVYTDDSGLNMDQGSASVYTRSGSSWTLQQTITQTNGRQYDNFGDSVALSSDGNTAIIGAYFGDVGYVNQGSASVFTRSGMTWTQQQTITQTDGAASDLFGVSVALSSDGNTAIVGAWFDDVDYVNQGSASVYTRSGTTWTQQQTITQTDGEFFGASVALSSDGNTAIVGAYPDDVGSSADQGSATAFVLAVVSGVPTSVSATSGANAQSVVSWTAPLSDGGSVITGYTVTANPGGQQCSWTSGSLSCTVTGLTNGTSYTFTVTATNLAGTSSASSASSAATPYTLSGVPTSVSATSGANAQSVVSWTAPSSSGGSTITGYTVTANPGGQQCSWTSGSLSCTVTGLTNGTSYTFTVTATNLAGTSSASSASTPAIPGYALTISTFSGSGTVTNSTGTMSCASVCTANQADSATITATPATGWVFSSWGGACSGATRVCSLLMNQARDVTVFFVEAPASTPPSGGGGGAAPSPTINILNNVTVNITVTTPVNVQWSPPVVGQPTTASFAAAPQTTYSISATSSARAAKTVRGSCRVKVGKAMCTIKIPAKGKWVVAITPKKKGKVGKPAKKTFKL